MQLRLHKGNEIIRDTTSNLGQYTIKRNGVHNRSVGLKHLIRSDLKLQVEKKDRENFSDWNADSLAPD